MMPVGRGLPPEFFYLTRMKHERLWAFLTIFPAMIFLGWAGFAATQQALAEQNLLDRIVLVFAMAGSCTIVLILLGFLLFWKLFQERWDVPDA